MTNVSLGTVTRCAHTTVYSKNHTYKKNPRYYAIITGTMYGDPFTEHVQVDNGYCRRSELEHKVDIRVRKIIRCFEGENISVQIIEENE